MYVSDLLGATTWEIPPVWLHMFRHRIEWAGGFHWHLFSWGQQQANHGMNAMFPSWTDRQLSAGQCLPLQMREQL